MPTQPKPTKKFRKLVLSPGRYPTGKDSSGNVQYEDFSSERLKKLAESGNTFLSTGARIPVPFAHYDDKGILVSPVNVGENGYALRDAFTNQPIGWRSDLNSGFVDSFEYGTIHDDETGKDFEGIISTLDIDESHIDKFGRTVRDASIGIQRNKEDENGTKYDELPIHIAACTNPVDSVQPNFEPIETMLSGNVILFNTSVPEEEEESGDKPKNPLIPEDPQTSEGPDEKLAHVVEALSQCGLHLPDDTTAENLVEYLSIIVKQKLSADHSAPKEEDDDDLTKQPKGGPPSGAPIAMSTQPTAPSTDLEKRSTLLFGQYLKTQRRSLSERIDALVKSGRINADYANKVLRPKVETINLANTKITDIDDDGNLPPSETEVIVMALEESAGEDLTKPNETSHTPKGTALDPPTSEELNHWGYENDAIDKQESEKLHKLSDSIPA